MEQVALDTLSDEHIAVLQGHEEVRQTSAGEVLVGEGDAAPGLVVVLSGLVAITDSHRGVEREISVQGEVALLARASSRSATGSRTSGSSSSDTRRCRAGRPSRG